MLAWLLSASGMWEDFQLAWKCYVAVHVYNCSWHVNGAVQFYPDSSLSHAGDGIGWFVYRNASWIFVFDCCPSNDVVVDDSLCEFAGESFIRCRNRSCWLCTLYNSNIHRLACGSITHLWLACSKWTLILDADIVKGLPWYRTMWMTTLLLHAVIVSMNIEDASNARMRPLRRALQLWN